MSDNSSSTGSSGSSANSWTLLSPEEAAVENIGPVDDGTESLGDVPSLSEEVAGATADIPVETILSEEGHQVCQETSPEGSEGPVSSSPTCLSPLPPSSLVPQDNDPESQPPVIHDIVTSSPGDNEHLGAMPFVTNIDLGTPLDIPFTGLPLAELESELTPPPPPIPEIPVSAEPVLDTLADVGLIPDNPVVDSPVPTAEPEVSIPTETLTASNPPSHVDADISPSPESSEAAGPVPESLAPESPIHDSHLPETVGPTEAAGEPTVEEEETELAEKVTQVEKEEAPEEPSSSFDFAKGDTSSDDDGLRRRNVPSFEALRPRTSDEEDEEEEMEFKLAEKKEENSGFSLNKCIVGAVVLLCLGSLYFSDDFDSSELSDGEQNQNWPNGDPKDMKEILDKLALENQQISQLEALLQSQKKELDVALKAAAAKGDANGKEDLEKENAKMRDELSSLPGLREELETLRARVTELTQLTANRDVQTTPNTAPPPGGQPGGNTKKAAGPERRSDAKEGGGLKEELQRQKVLLEESKKRLEGMKRSDGGRKGVRDGLQEIQKRLSEQVERLGERKPRESKWNGSRGKDDVQDRRKKEERKERGGEKGKRGKEDGGRREKEERREDGKPCKQNSHKEAWRKSQDDWERKKDERRMDREERRKQKPWHSQPTKNPHGHSHHHQHQQPHRQPHQRHQPHQYNHDDFWRHQGEKLRRNIRPRPGCSTAEDCASKEGLYVVELSEFEELLEAYLSKLEGSPPESRDEIRKLTAEFFEDGMFAHGRVLFGDFAEDVADILEDMADVLEDEGQDGDNSLEEEMEEFEREALWKFAATA
ncbi:uncharacterized protein pbxip1a isoform 1-T2 [Polymixia lowei]